MPYFLNIGLIRSKATIEVLVARLPVIPGDDVLFSPLTISLLHSEYAYHQLGADLNAAPRRQQQVHIVRVLLEVGSWVEYTRPLGEVFEMVF